VLAVAHRRSAENRNWGTFAAIAAITTSFIAEPVLTSPGGGGFMLIADSRILSRAAFYPAPSVRTNFSIELLAYPAAIPLRSLQEPGAILA